MKKARPGTKMQLCQGMAGLSSRINNGFGFFMFACPVGAWITWALIDLRS